MTPNGAGWSEGWGSFLAPAEGCQRPARAVPVGADGTPGRRLDEHGTASLEWMSLNQAMKNSSEPDETEEIADGDLDALDTMAEALLDAVMRAGTEDDLERPAEPGSLPDATKPTPPCT
jgi:hypothetical protein